MTKKSKKTKTAKENLPELVTVMAKFVERIEALEKKMDQVLGRVSNLPAEIRQAAANVASPAPFPPAAPAPQVPQGRILHEAICADCHKGCKVPFRPNESRPVYCPACWAIRKVGHKPQNPDQGSLIPKEKRVMPVFHPMDPQMTAAKGKKQKKTAKKKTAKPAKKK